MSGQISHPADDFHGYTIPEKGIIVGYGALQAKYKLPVPLPYTISQ